MCGFVRRKCRKGQKKQLVFFSAPAVFFCKQAVTTLSRGSKVLLDHGRSRFENPTRTRFVKRTYRTGSQLQEELNTTKGHTRLVFFFLRFRRWFSRWCWICFFPVFWCTRRSNRSAQTAAGSRCTRNVRMAPALKNVKFGVRLVSYLSGGYLYMGVRIGAYFPGCISSEPHVLSR